ncbi:hypothetical protein MNBD_BACTEROID03-372 [hydrothermal vent metagenome]|uniref:Uncharacterized protein n=1 Tax=hydrothermal vent metagenome TaxID=652676 RepID=A0A3B0TAG0_9ZZZZ
MTPLAGFGQEDSKQINGRVKSLSNDVSNVLIINLNSKKSTITDSLGLFDIEAKLKDSIRFTAVQYLTKEIIITDSIFSEEVISVNLVENVINLKEVTVTPYNLTGDIILDVDRLDLKPIVTNSSLGLQNADINPMTQNERMLQEADRGTFVRMMTIEDHGRVMEILGYGLNFGIIINSHKVMNRVSGRTQYYRQAILRDQALILEKDIIDMFTKKSMSEEFKIPETSIDGFLTYCLAQPDFSELLQAGNSMIIWNYLREKSDEFKE